MSSVSNAYRVAGPTYAISVTASQSTPLAIVPSPGENQANYLMITNTGTTVVCGTIAPYAPPASAGIPTALAFPVAGTPTLPVSFVLGVAPSPPLFIAAPDNGCAIAFIGSGAGPSLVYVTYVNQA